MVSPNLGTLAARPWSLRWSTNLREDFSSPCNGCPFLQIANTSQVFFIEVLKTPMPARIIIADVLIF